MRDAAARYAGKRWLKLVNQIIIRRMTGGLSQERLAELAGTGKSTITKLETGRGGGTCLAVLKLLYPMGLTLAIVPIEDER
jgi:transcriptional regulator with XRE-family HTH domain